MFSCCLRSPYFLVRNKKRVDPNGGRGGEELEGVESGETAVGIYYM